MADHDKDPLNGATGNNGTPRRPQRPLAPAGTRPPAPVPASRVARVEPSSIPAPAQPRPAPIARPAAPARPALPPRPAMDGAPVEAPEAQFTIDEDDSVIVPEPTVEMLAHVRPTAPARQRNRFMRSTSGRRTVIPILLTTGAMLIAAGVVRAKAPADSPLGATPSWASAAGYSAGALLMAAGALNMLAVRAEIQRPGQRHSPPR